MVVCEGSISREAALVLQNGENGGGVRKKPLRMAPGMRREAGTRRRGKEHKRGLNADREIRGRQ